MSKFKFSKMLTDPGEQQGIRDYLADYQAEANRRKAESERLSAKFEDLLDSLRLQHKIPRGLSILIDPNHLNEHGVIFVHSQETDETPATDERRTIQ